MVGSKDNTIQQVYLLNQSAPHEQNYQHNQGCGNTMPDLSDVVRFHSGQVENFNLLVFGQVQNLL